ncbi:unnamed protein product [Mucor hiemalis]
MRQYVDRFNHLLGLYNRQRQVKEDWSEISATVLKDTFINGIKPTALKMLVKQHLPQTLAEAQTTAIRESEEESESDLEDSSDEDSEEVVIVKKKPAKKIEKKKQTSAKEKQSNKEKNVKEDKSIMDNKAMEDLTKSFQKFSLFVENGGLEQMEIMRKQMGSKQSASGPQCFNCQDWGHTAHECPRL